MKSVMVLAVPVILASAAAAQVKKQVHTPAEILKIMTDSKENYELGLLEKPIEAKNRQDNLNFNDVYRKQTGNGFSTVHYSMNRELQDAVTKAEDAFHDNKYEEARQWYLRSLTIDSTYYTVMTYIGQTYGIERNWDKAIEWYNKVISLNYIDYMAHWFLADAYQATGRPEEAKKEIITAHILNRNNPRIRTALISILKANHLKLDDWTFNPQYSVSKDANNKIQVKYGDGWLPFALTKAVWAFEPGYRESMGYENENTFRELEEKEALIGMLLSDDPKTKNLPETIALEKATKDTKNNLLQEYIFYEILLPEHPAVAFQLPDNFIEAISTYLLKVRCSKLE